MPRRYSRLVLTLATAAVLGSALTYAFWPRPVLVDMGTVYQGAMQVTIAEQGHTRVHDTYIVSTPVAGRLLRVEVEPGDHVTRGETVIAQMLPQSPSALDIRTREQASASVAAAVAALRLARAELNRAEADLELARDELERARQLHERGISTEAALNRARTVERKAYAALDTAEAAISMREAELANARARLIGFDDVGLAAALGELSEGSTPLMAPSTGSILRVMQQSETAVEAGTPIMEIGNVANDLEVLVELLSTDAVKIDVGDNVLVDDWGGDQVLSGKVVRIDPFGFTKFSSLGVEEQRVNAVIELTSDAADYVGLGHGFRVEVHIIIWESNDVLIVPSSALFRDGESWAVSRVENQIARYTPVIIGRNNGIEAEVLDGLSAGDRVVLYPSSVIEDGTFVAQRHLN